MPTAWRYRNSYILQAVNRLSTLERSCVSWLYILRKINWASRSDKKWGNEGKIYWQALERWITIWYDLKKLLWKDELNTRVRCAFGNVWSFGLLWKQFLQIVQFLDVWVIWKCRKSSILDWESLIGNLPLSTFGSREISPRSPFGLSALRDWIPRTPLMSGSQATTGRSC